MIFENIKIGDKVLVRVFIKIAWNKRAPFRVAEKVTNVTKTQFTTESNKRFNKDGRAFGGYGTALHLDHVDIVTKKPVIDQSREIEMLKLKIKIKEGIDKKIKSFDFNDFHLLSTERLGLIDVYIDEINALINNQANE